MKTKILIAVLLGTGVLAACTPVPSPKPVPQPYVTNTATTQTLTLPDPITIVALHTPRGDVQLTKISVDNATHAITFYFDQAAPGKSFTVVMKQQPGDPCIVSMTMLSRRLATELNTKLGNGPEDNISFECVATTTALKNNGNVTNFLRQSGALCR